MVEIEVNLTPKGRKALTAMERPDRWIDRKVVPQVTLWLARRIERYAKKLSPKRTGGGRRSIDVTRIDSGHAIVSDLHMLVMEEGRKPGGAMPPPDALEIWGRRVLGREGLGFVLARSIQRKGIRPRLFFRRAIHKATKIEKSKLDNHVGRVIRAELKKESERV